MIRVRRALFSAYHKEGLVPLAREVAQWQGEIVSSGGTAAFLKEEGLSVTTVEAVTGSPSLFGGRVKTLHPRIHGGILFRRDDPDDVRTAKDAGILPIDLVVVNLYPFESILGTGAAPDEAIELIDIGGPALVRAAAKNHRFVAVVTLPEDYERVRAALRAGQGSLDESFCRELAARAFATTAAYDSAIAGWFAGGGSAGAHQEASSSQPRQEGSGTASQPRREDSGAPLQPRPESSAEPSLPEHWDVHATLQRRLRYGENPSQLGGLYGSGRDFPFNLEQIHGKEISYNNLLDLGCGRDVCAEFGGRLVAVVIKHGIPCGVALGETLAEAYRRARDADSLSAYGGVVILNREVDAATAEILNETFLEVILAPGYAPEARTLLEKKKNRVLLQCPGAALTAPASALRGRFVGSGFLLQTPMAPGLGEDGWQVVSRRAPDARERDDLLFGWKVLKHVRSNGVLFARDGRTVGVGSGQCSRIDSTEAAIRKARRENLDLKGAVMLSDAFFPFRDSVDLAAGAGITAVLQPGGSVRDEESITACDEHGLAMALNGARVFSHG